MNFDAVYINSPKPYQSNEVNFGQEIDFNYAEVSIKAIGIDDPKVDEPIFLTPIKSEIRGFEAVESSEGENQFYLCFDAAQIIFNEKTFGNNIKLAEEEGLMIYFKISVDGEEVDYETENFIIYRDWLMDLSLPMEQLDW